MPLHEPLSRAPKKRGDKHDSQQNKNTTGRAGRTFDAGQTFDANGDLTTEALAAAHQRRGPITLQDHLEKMKAPPAPASAWAA